MEKIYSNGVVNGNISIGNGASIATEPERKKLSCKFRQNEGGLIHNIELDEPDRAMDNHRDDSV